MANTYTPIDTYALFNDIVKQATGRADLTAVDTTTFATVGETALKTGTENVLNAISTVLARTIFSVRPYTGKLETLRVASERWGAMTRKLVPLIGETAEPSTDYNTNIQPNQLDDGNSIDMYKIRKQKMVQLNFIGTKKLQKHVTRFRDQLSVAFSNPTEFQNFMDALAVQWYNEIELINENQSRLTLVNFIAGLQDMSLGNVIDLVATYNTDNGTQYTRSELLSTHLKEFMSYVAGQIKIYANYLTDYSVMYHANITGYDPIARHTPKDRQKLIMYSPIFIKTQAEVYPTLFNPEYLDIGTFEGVNFWQNKKTPTQVSAKPNVLDINTGESVDGNNVTIPYVLGILFDEEACGVVPQFDYASTTPFNSAGGYYNLYQHWRFNSYVDFTENALLFVLGEGGSSKK